MRAGTLGLRVEVDEEVLVERVGAVGLAAQHRQPPLIPG